MGLHCIEWAFKEDVRDRRGRPDPRAKLVLVRLAHAAKDDDPSCWPSHKLLARECGMVRSTVQKKLNALEEARHIHVAHRFRPDGSRSRSTNLYKLGPPPEDEWASPSETTARMTKGGTLCPTRLGTPPPDHSGRQELEVFELQSELSARGTRPSPFDDGPEEVFEDGGEDSWDYDCDEQGLVLSTEPDGRGEPSATAADERSADGADPAGITATRTFMREELRRLEKGS